MARRNEEATIKLSADTKDVQAAFDKVSVAYGDLQKAAEEHAKAVEMAAKAVTDDEKAIAAEYEKTTRAILKSENARVNSLKKSANAQKGQAEIMRGNTKETKLNTEAIKGAALGLAGLAVALGKAAQKYMEVDAAAGRLKNANKAAGASAEDVAAQQSAAREALVNYGITTLDSTNALQKLTDASGDAGKAATDYKLAIDIASQANISLEQATEMLSKARNGEVEELKSLRDINKEQAQDLGKIEDSTIRAELAVKMLTAAYAGSAEANAGAIDKTAAMKAQLDETATAAGNVATAIGEAGVGLVGALAKLIGLAETGDEFFEKFTSGMNNFAGSIREVSQPIYDLVAAGGALGMLVNGKSIADVLSEADSARARAAAAAAKTPKTEAPKKADVKKEVDAELAKQAEKVEKKAADAAAQREKERAASSARARRDAQERAREKEAERVAAEATREAEAQAAQLKAEAAKIADEAAQREISQREIYNQTLINEAIARGEDITLLQSQLELEERLVEIRNSDMSAEEQARQNRLALLKQEVVSLNEAAKAADAKKKKDDDAAKKKEEETEMLEGNLESLAMTSLAAAEQQNLATALQSAKKVGFYGAEAIASFAAGNPISGAGYLAAAAEHAINAGTAVAGMASGGGGGGGAAASPAETAPRSFGPSAMAMAEAREGSITINQNMLSYMSPEDARRYSSSERREARAIVGGRRR